MRAFPDRPIHAWFAITLWLLSGLTQADSQTNSDLESNSNGDGQPVDSITIVGERSLASELAGSQALTTIDREVLDDQLATSTVDLFRGQAGVFVQQTTPGQGIPIVRGLKGSEVLHLMDGFRINNALFRNAPNQYLALIDSNSIAFVDLVRGAPGTLFGSDAMGGVIQFASMTPDDAPPVRLRLRGRSNDPEAMAHLGLSGRGETVSARLGLTTQHVGDRKTASGQRLPSAYRSEAADASVQWSLTPRQSLRFLVQYVNQPRTSRVDRLVPGFGETEPQNLQADFAPNRRSFGLLRYSIDDPVTWLDDVSLQVGRQVVRDDRETQRFGSDRITNEANKSTLDGLRAFATTRRGAHVVHFGVDAYRDTIDSARFRTRDGITVEDSARFPDGAEQTNADVFLAHRWRLSTPLQLHWGVRYSSAELDLPGRESDPAVAISSSAFSGDLGLNWQFSVAASLLFKASRGFRAPNVFDVANLGERPGNRFSIPNPDLGPETVDSLELGLRWQSGDWFAEAFVFQSRFDDRITSVLTGETDEQDRDIVQTRNAASARFRGMETRFSWQASARWLVELSGNWLRAREQLPGETSQPADRIPPLNGQLQVSWDAGSNWTLGSRLLAAAEQDRLNPRDSRDARINPEGTPGWADLGLFGRWQPDQDWDVRVRLDNLLDRAYREHGSGLDRPGRALALELIWSPS